MDSEGIRDYLEELELPISEQVVFLTNLEAAVEQTWDKVVEHYDQVFHEIVSEYYLQQTEEKQEELAMKQEDGPTIEMTTEASRQSRDTVRAEIDDNLTFKVEPIKSVVIGAEEIEELISKTDNDAPEKTELLSEERKQEAEKARVQELFQHPIFRDSTDTIDYLLENYVTSQELEMLISYFEHESELPISLTQAQYALTEVEATLNIDALVNSFEQKSEYLDRNIKAFKNSWSNYQDTSAEEIYQIYKSFQHPVFRNYSATINYLLSHSVSSQELETLIVHFEHEQKLPIPLFTATAALEEVRAEQEKAPEVSQGQEKNAEGTVGDFPDKQEAAPLPEANQSQPLNDLSPNQTQPQPYLHFTINEEGKSIDKRNYHVISDGELVKLNRYASNLQQAANWYLDTVAGSKIIYFYQEGDVVNSLQVTFDRDKFLHLTGVFPYKEGQTAEQSLLDFAQGKGAFDAILLANKGAAFDKLKVLPELSAITDAHSFYFGDLSDVPKLHSLDMNKAIKSGDEDIVLALRTADQTTFPASLMKLREGLKIQLDQSQQERTILGIYRDRDGVVDQLSIREEIVKDGGQVMLSILTNKQYEEILERRADKELNQEITKETKASSLKETAVQDQGRDTDGDGVSDKVERSLGTDPYDVTSTPHQRAKEEERQAPIFPQKTLVDILNEKDTKALSAHLKEGMKKYVNSDQYKNFLTAMSHFHDYSTKNIQLILAQNPTATQIASYQTWKGRFGRQVQKGEKGIKIFVPIQIKVRDENGEVRKDENGQEITTTRFKLGTVFDVKQTEGKELPKPLHLLEGTVPDYETLYRASRQVSLDNHVPISFKAIEIEANGYYNVETKEIVIAEKQMSEAQIMKTLFHEMAHSRLHHPNDSFTSTERELQAESIAYVVASHYGIDTSDYSFTYLHLWSDDQKNYSDLEAQLKVIQSESKRMMEKIDVRLEEVKTKSKFADKLQSKLEKAEAETKKAIEQKRAEEKTQVAKKSPVPQKEH